jgi:pullulanase
MISKRKIIMNAALALSIALPATTTAQSDYDKQFNDYPTYQGSDLELAVNNQGTQFKLWSPKAEEAMVKIYAEGKGGNPLMTLQMTLDKSTGTWSSNVAEKLYGKFYTFQIKKDGKWLAETPGVWAKAVGINGNRAAIIDFAKTNPCGWTQDKGP